ncbi:MAG: ATP-dependent RecD-like DNA helicase [Lachnospiraceae bacterium]|nr:ATP-dependent RecD-like DNA helicase [Lachnospiraceae bacterium]
MTIEGYVSRILYQNKENGYTVLVLECAANQEADGSEQTVFGTMPGIDQGDFISATGEITVHPVYGPQLRADTFERKMPSDAVSIERYLASGAVKGIGPALAKRVVKKFGADTLRIMEQEPERLSEIKGISEKKAREIAGGVAEKKNMRDAMMFLQQYGISLNLGAKIYNYYGIQMYSILKTNPYKMADDIDGVGFKTADEIASKVGIVPDSDFRVQSGLLYILNQSSLNGHTYLPKSRVLEEGAELLQVEPSQIEKNLVDMQMDRRIVIKQKGDEEPQVYSSMFYYMELNIARQLHDLNIYEEGNIEQMKKMLAQIEKREKLELDELQRQAVYTAVTHGLTVITGGPGTGKTTTINTIIQYFDEMGLSLKLAAPTGRAAKRMTEATGYEAATIHRMLELSGAPEGEGRASFARNEENPLEVDAIIVDEMSMVDVNLMNALLKAIVPGTRLVLVGDVDQLPSVGPGNVLKDIIASECFTVVKLNRIFRQALESDIVINAHKINNGERVEKKTGSRDFLFVLRDNAANVVGATMTLVRDKLPSYVGASYRDIQVLTPMRKGVLGVENLNKALQNHLNPADPEKMEKESGDVTFREGDKVMQIKNNYQMEWEVLNERGFVTQNGVGVFNGDVGTITQINLYAEEMTVEFDERRQCVYSFKQLDELELAYAVTIHKSQGSEYPAVVLPILTGPKMLMNRNLLYTAVTRAKKCVVIVGSEKCFQDMIDNISENTRFSGLKDRIVEIYG